MTRPRSALISLDATPYYHCIARCVRRAFLCGNDRYTGRNFDHRKPWLLERLTLLTEVFAIDVAAYAVMSNHYHIVLHVDVARGLLWSEADVLDRWLRLYKGPELIRRYKAGDVLTKAELILVRELIERWRERLCNVSWFMRCLNEYLARRANAEDGCKGRFWEARFKSQALLDEAALLSCMTYVDLNPIRAGIAADLEHSNYTSVQSRIARVRTATDEVRPARSNRSPQLGLMPFSEATRRRENFAYIPFRLEDYLDLVDWTGRLVRPDKKGSIAGTAPKLLDSLKISPAEWRILALEVQKQAVTMLHGLNTLSEIAKRRVKQAA